MNNVVVAPRGEYGLERPVVRTMASVTCGPEGEESLRTVSTQTRPEFAIRSSSMSSAEREVAVDEESMDAGGSSTAAVVGVCGGPEVTVSVVVPSVSGVGGPNASGTALSLGRPVRSGN